MINFFAGVAVTLGVIFFGLAILANRALKEWDEEVEGEQNELELWHRGSKMKLIKPEKSGNGSGYGFGNG